MIEEFIDWHNGIKEQVKKVTAMTSIPLSDEPEALIRDLQQIEAWNARINFLLADANGWLDKAKNAFRPAREEGTESDRRAILDATTSGYRVVRDKLESLANCIKQRLILGESLLRYHTQFHERNIFKKS